VNKTWRLAVGMFLFFLIGFTFGGIADIATAGIAHMLVDFYAAHPERGLLMFSWMLFLCSGFCLGGGACYLVCQEMIAARDAELRRIRTLVDFARIELAAN
jgi:hypothetical protein